jgi:crotonobetainyl-CoA:carnitine CoA-transferase CaiB-like acyl-CoA transferase
MTLETDLPLSGLRVLDLTTTIFGPYTTQTLGDFGADIIKIEAPGGDALRGVGPARNEGMGAVFLGANRNKRSLALDLKRDDAREALWRLIDRSDALVHNMRPQKIAAIGFDPEAVMGRNPKLVYGALYGYLQEGPYGGRPAYDDVVQGECGLAATFAARDGEPQLVPSVIVDKNAALIAANGIIAALLQRQRTGKGVLVETGMFEGMVAYNLVEHQYGTMFSPPEGKAGYPRTLSPNRRPFPTRDGYVCMLAYTDKQWRAFWKLAGQADKADDERFATIGARTHNIDALYSETGAILAGKDTGEWLELLGAAEIPAGPVNNFEDLRADPHLQAIGFYRPYDHPSEGPLEIPDTAYRFNKQKLPVRQHQPRLGEQSREILDEAGFSPDEIDVLLSES